MPFGLGWGQYGVLIGSSLASMLAGGAAVHAYYKPDLTIPDQPPPKPKVAPRIAVVPARGHRDGDADRDGSRYD